MTFDEQIRALQAKIEAIEADPKNHTRPGEFWKYTPSARKRLDNLAMQIAGVIAEKRKAEGRPVPCDGYSGRQTNKR